MNIIDIIIVSIYLIAIGCVGLHTRKYVSDFSDFMVAGRKMNLSLAVVTMLGTELGLITVMYSSKSFFIIPYRISSIFGNFSYWRIWFCYC